MAKLWSGMRTLPEPCACEALTKERPMEPTLEPKPIDPNTAAFLREARASAFDFHGLSVKAAGDERLKAAVSSNTQRQYEGRQLIMLQLPDSNKLRVLAGEIKQHALDHLDYYLEQLAANVEKNGGHVHFAHDGADAREHSPRHRRKAAQARHQEQIDGERGNRPRPRTGSQAAWTSSKPIWASSSSRSVTISRATWSRRSFTRTRHRSPSLFSEYFKTPYNDDPACTDDAGPDSICATNSATPTSA